MSSRIIAVRRMHESGPQLLRSLLPIFLVAVAGSGVAGAQSALPHFAAGGSFVTGFYVVNTRNQPGRYSISFHDDSGRSVALSFSGLGSRTTLSETLPANGANYYEADSPSGALLSGSGMITADAGINIQALFRRRGSGADYSEAAILASPGANQFTIPFDGTVFSENGAQIYTGLALVNMDAQQIARVTCTARDAQGAVIPRAVPIPALNPLGHWAGYQFPALLQKRGTLDCSSNTKVGSVALRFLGSTMSSLPVVAAGDAEGGLRVLPHFAVGAGFTTAFYVVNTGSQRAAYKLSFHNENGEPVALSFAGLGSLDSLSDVLPAHGAKYYEADSPTGALVSGAAYVGREPNITVQAVFRRRGSAGDYSEAAIPASPGVTRFTIPFDDTVFAENGSQIYTGLALENTDLRTAHVNCTARDAQGAVIANAVTVPDLPPYGHWVGYEFPALLGKRGTLACISDTRIAPVALRFRGNAMSSLPIILSDTNAGPGPNPGPSSGLIEFHDRNGKFSFQYPANFAILFNDRDPVNTGMTLIRLATADGSQKLEVRYMAHTPDYAEMTQLGDRIEQEFNRTQMQAIFQDWHFGNDSTESGATLTHIWTNNLRDKNIEVIGTAIWSRYDYADIVFGYDRSRASTSGRDTVFRTLTFATTPSILGRWKSSSLEMYFEPDGSVDVGGKLDNGSGASTTGQYTIANDRVDILLPGNGQLRTWHCGYSVTLAHLRLNCGADGSAVLLTQPNIDNFGLIQ
jgi:hypothetical protein